MVSKLFDKRSKGILSKKVLGFGIENKQLDDEPHKPIIKKFKRRQVYSSFKDNIWSVDLADMQLISKFNKGTKYLLCVFDLFSKYTWVVPLKDKKGASIVNAFQKILKRKPNKIWVDHDSEFYNNFFKKFSKNNDIEMYSTHNEGKSVVAKRFIRTLKNKIYKHMTTIGKNVYFNVLDDIVDKYNNTYHRAIKMKPKDVTDDSFAECSEEFNKKDPRFKIGDNVRISKYKNTFANDYTPEIVGSFYEKELQKTDQKEFGIEK